MRVRFDRFTLNVDSRQLFRGDVAIHLSPKAFDLLTLLAEHRPRAFSKAELHARLWPDTFVSDARPVPSRASTNEAAIEGNMKALILQVSDEELARRRLTGIDRYDEMCQGVLHMPPAPAYEHQRIVSAIDSFLGPLCERRGRGVLAPAINVFNEAAATQDYRIPDLTFVAAARRHIIAHDGIRGAGPDAVIEIRSPDDETYDKLPFFARLGVGEAIVVDRDTKKPEIYRLAGSQYLVVQPDSEGWLRSEMLKVRLACTEGRLVTEDLDDPSARVDV